jgi:hypothetical protein
MKKHRFLWLLIFPVIYFITGAYFHNVNGLYSVKGADPEYIYFVNGLSVANGMLNIGNIDHPGIPFDYIMALSLRATHFFRSQNKPFTQDVLANPDLYLRVANLVIIMTVMLVILGSGIIALRITGNLWISLIVQFSPFCTDILYGNIGRLPTENLIPVPVMLLILILLKILEQDDRELMWKDILLLSGVTALALSLKMTLAPLVIIPFFLIKPLKNKLIYVLATTLIFLAFSIPVTLQLHYFYNWMKSLVLYSGQYGQGDKDIAKLSEMWPNIVSLIRANRLYFTYVLIALVSFAAVLVSSRRKMVKRSEKVVAVTIFVVVALMVLVLGKQYKTAYFIPALVLLPVIVILTVRFAGYLTGGKISRYLVPGYILLVILLMFRSHIPVIRDLSVHFGKQNEQRMKAYYFLQNIEKDAVKIIVPGYYGAPVPEYALMTSYQWSARQKSYYKPVLAGLYPDTYLLYPWDQSLNFWGDSLRYDPGRPFYIYFDKLKQKEELASTIAQLLPDSLFWKPLFYQEETEEAIFKLLPPSKGAE